MPDKDVHGTGSRWVTEGLYDQVAGGVIAGIIVAVATVLMTRNLWLGLLFAALAGAGASLIIGGLLRSRRPAAKPAPGPQTSITDDASIVGDYSTAIKAEHVHIYPSSPQEAQARPPFTLPPDLPTFTGRADLLRELDDLLHPGGQTAVSIVGLKGMAGVGKSALAIHAAYGWRERFPDGVVWVDLRGQTAACDALRHVAGLYDYHDQAACLGDDRQGLVGLVRTILHEKRTLLIFDNAEALSTDDLDCLLLGVHGPVTVVTSRRAFPALDRLGHLLRVDVMDEKEGLDFLGRLVGLGKVEAEREGYAKLAERLGYLPLALDIAGRRMRERSWSTAQMLANLETAVDLPAFLALPLAEKPEDSVALAFALSYDALAESDQGLFRTLSPFAPAGFTPQTVAAVLDQEEDVAGVEAALERLEALSLVRRTRDRTEPTDRAAARYDLHPLLHDYARALAERAGEQKSLAEQYVRCFTALAGWGRDQLGDPKTALGAIAQAAMERANLLAAQEAVLAQGLWDEAIHLAYRLNNLFERSGHWADRRRALEAGIDAAGKAGDKREVALLANNLGIAYQQIGEYTDARLHYEASLHGLEEVSEKRSIPYASVLHQLGLLAQDQGDYAEARRLYQESLDIKQQLGHRAGVAYTLGQMGNLAYAQGDLGEARRLYDQVRDVSQQMGDRRSVAKALHQLGLLAQDQGDYAEARRLYQESLDIEQQLGDRAGVALSRWGLGNLAQDQSDFVEAERQWQAALVTFCELSDRKNQAGVLHQLGVLAQGQGDYAEARRLYDESLAIAQQLGDRAGAAVTVWNLGNVAYLQGDPDDARNQYQDALTVFRELGDRRNEAGVLHQLGVLAQDQGDYAEARRLYGEAAETFEQLGNRAGVATSLAQLALLEEAEGHIGRALELIRQAEATFTDLNSPHAAQARQVRERLERQSP